jgi:hypothetical protein
MQDLKVVTMGVVAAIAVFGQIGPTHNPAMFWSRHYPSLHLLTARARQNPPFFAEFRWVRKLD